MPMHDDCMKDYGKDYEEYPMYPQMPMMGGMPMMGCGMPYPHMPMMGCGMPMPTPYPQMPVMGEYDKEELCYMEHMNEYMAYMCKAEACRVRAMQCMHKK